MRRRRRAASSRAFGLVLWLAASSCGLFEGAATAVLDVNTCESDEPCLAAGGACDLELGGCIAPDLVNHGLVLQVLEPDSSASSEHLLVASELNGAAPTDLTLRRRVSVRGLVLDARAASSPLAARIVFKRRPELSGLSAEPLYAESAKTTVSEPDRAQPTNFSITLAPGTYDVEVDPAVMQPAQAPAQLYYPIRETITVGSGAEVTFADFRYDDETRRILGRVADAAGQPLGGVRVFAHHPEDGRRLSNVALTECEAAASPGCGIFELAVPPDASTFRLRLQGAEADPRLPVVDLGVYSFDTLDLDADGTLSREELPDARFPALASPVLVSAQVVGQDRSGLRNPLPGATVLFRTDRIGDPASPVGSLEARTTTDESGNTVAEGRLAGPSGIWLPPAAYRVSISPPAESGYAAAEVELVVEPVPEGEVLTVSLQVGPRQRVSGRIGAADGTPVPQVRIEAAAASGATFAATGADDGSFAIDLDPGHYDLTFVTPEPTLLPWALNLGLSVFDDLSQEITAGLGTPFRGRVVREPAAGPGTDPTPVAGAVLSAFVEAGEGETTRLVRIGRAVTGLDGSFTILLPRLEPVSLP